ncbi:hypothetical protein [Geobacillus sp. YHL]|uniref:hypothetical protein n=1 Tax=Geobacillus sp. YHL TaxID=2796117 RepID=UPI001EF0C726|nr:hypothetical protein [Geobacillus sp. YHL]MCG6794497.1 hypothetical protein [Geobacillus sp. YHL]
MYNKIATYIAKPITLYAVKNQRTRCSVLSKENWIFKAGDAHGSMEKPTSEALAESLRLEEYKKTEHHHKVKTQTLFV